MRMDALAQRQELQVQREEANTQYLVSLMAYYHNPSSSSTMPPIPPPLFEFLNWPPLTPPGLRDGFVVSQLV